MGFIEDDIRRNAINQRLVVVVGAGVAMGATRGESSASWIGLLKNGAERCFALRLADASERARILADVEAGSTDRLLSAAEAIARHLGAPDGGEYVAWLRDTVGSLETKDGTVIDALRGFGCRIATTNYDSLIEDSTGFQPVTWQDRARAQTWFSGEDTRQVLHLHGHWRSSGSVVLGIRSYEDVLRDRYTQTLLRALPLGYSLLFVGFGAGLSDPNFGALLRFVDDVFRETTNRHYRLVLEQEVAEVKGGGLPRLFPVTYGKAHGDLGPFLNALVPPRGVATPASGSGPMRSHAGRPRRFFISYRHGGPDEALADRLHAALERGGHSVQRDVGLQVGDDWATALRQQIEASDFFVPLLSAASVGSEMVVTEVRAARRKSRRDGRPKILPVRVAFEDAFEYELNLYVGHLQHVRWSSEADDAAVTTALLNAVKGIDLLPPVEGPGSALPMTPSAGLAAVGTQTSMPPIDDTHYVETATHRKLSQLVEHHPVALTLFAPRGYGKTRLLNQYLASCRARARHVVHVDLRGFEDAIFEDYGAFLNAVASEVLNELRIYRSATVAKQEQMRRFMQVEVLEQVQGPIVLAIDEVDRVVSRAYKSNFFAMLRSWSSKSKAGDPLWSRLALALVVSVEPELLIDDPRTSPFNVGEQLELTNLSLEECTKLSATYQPRLRVDQIVELYELLRGHPYLTRRAHVALEQGLSFAKLTEEAPNPDGPFRDHLRALKTRLAKDPRLTRALRAAIHTGTIPKFDTKDGDPEALRGELARRLCAIGALVEKRGRYEPANLLYSRFFLQVT